MQDYQPILVGAGCPALGYMYGRHCRFHLGNLIDVSTASEAACCKQTESGNYVSEHATVHHRKSSAMRPARCPTESALVRVAILFQVVQSGTNSLRRQTKVSVATLRYNSMLRTSTLRVA